MKILMLSLSKLWYRVGMASYATDESIIGKEFSLDGCLLILIHVEREDIDRKNKLVRKLLNNIRWYSRKTGVNRVVLHSFAHLSESKADPEYARDIIITTEKKLKEKGLEVYTTPFGYFLDLEIRIKAEPIARVFKEL